MKKIRLCVLLALLLSLIATAAVAGAGVYDSANDPIMTVSGMVKWLEENFRPSINTAITESVTPLQTSIASVQESLETANGKIAELEAQLTALQQQYDALASTPGGGYEVVHLAAGTKLLATSTCDLILRSGSAAVVSPFTGDNPQGLSNLTTGADLLAGTEIPTNHHLIVPRGNDGRGIVVTSADGAYVMIQGGYQLVQP